MEFKKRPEYVNFFILEDIDDKSYSDLKKSVMEKIKEIEKIDEENEQYALSMGLDMKPLKTNVKFNFHVSTYGGVVYDGLGICDLLSRLDREDNGIDVTVICEGKIMSMGIPIVLSVRNRVCTPHTSFMIHQISGWYAGKLEDIKEDAEEMKRLWFECRQIIVENSKITSAELDEWDKCRANIYFDANKALEMGIVNDII